MNAIHQLLTDHIDIWTAADTEKKSGRGRSSGNAVSVYGIKKLRELILELAVRGKLVPQDPNDEPARELLKRIHANINTIPVDQHPFSLPKGWEWIKFGDALDFQGGGQPPKHAFSDTKLDGYVQLIQIRDLGERPQPVFIKKELAAKFCTPEDIMIGRYGASVGKVFWGKNGAYNVALVKIIDEFGIYYNRFLYEFFRCPHGQSFFSGISRSAQAGFNKSDIECQLMPVCSHAEQHRIVAKVDELMALCDQLETQHSNAAEAHEKLVSYLLGTLTLSQSTEDFSANWQRIAAHFDTLFTTEASIDALKQTLLQLAVMGKLVPQDPNDEPASELLKRIQAEKAKLISEGKIRKDKALSPIAEHEKPFDLPHGWEWVRLSEITSIRGGGTPSMAKSEYWSGNIPWVSPKDMHNGIIVDSELKITDKALKESNLELVPVGSILIVGRSGILKRKLPAQITAVPCTVNQDIKAVTPIEPLSDRYMQLIFWGNEKEILTRDVKQGTTVQSLVYESLFSRPFSFPPADEQHRIIAKVDELMAICDQLKVRITEANQLQQKLADVVVEQAIS